MLLTKQLMVAIDLVFFSILCKSMATVNLMVSKYDDTEYFRLNDPLKSTWNQNWSFLSIMPNLHSEGDRCASEVAFTQTNAVQRWNKCISTAVTTVFFDAVGWDGSEKV